MKQHLEQLLTDAVHGLQAAGGLPDDLEINIQIERTRDRAHGDFACNVALTLAKTARRNRVNWPSRSSPRCRRPIGCQG